MPKSSPSHPDEMLTLMEVAQLLLVADRTIDTMAACRTLVFKVRGQWRFKCDDLDQWIERQKLSQRDHDKSDRGRDQAKCPLCMPMTNGSF